MARRKTHRKKRNRQPNHVTPDGSYSHRMAQQFHSIKRARERYGLELDDYAYSKLCQQIGDRKDCLVIRRQRHDSKEVMGVRFDGRCYAVVYDPITRAVATFLPPQDYGLTQ